VCVCVCVCVGGGGVSVAGFGEAQGQNDHHFRNEDRGGIRRAFLKGDGLLLCGGPTDTCL